MLKAIIFDVDGTMADTEEVHRRAFNEIFSEYKLDWHWDKTLYGELLGVTGGKERIAHYIRDYLNGDPTEVDIPALHSRKTSRYVEIIRSGEVELRPGVERLIAEAFSRDIKLAIATTTSPENVSALIEATLGASAMQYFSVIAAGDCVPRKKPAPDIYDAALQGLELAAENCIAIEDSENGLRSALGAGVQTLVTVNDYTSAQNFSGACAVVSDLGETDKPCRFLAGAAIAGNMISVDWLVKALSSGG